MDLSISTFPVRFPNRRETFTIDAADIIRFEADSNYTIVHTKIRRPFIMPRLLKEYEKLLAPFDFIRVNRTDLLNKNRISHITEQGTLVMDDEFAVQISRRKKKTIRETLNQ